MYCDCTLQIVYEMGMTKGDTNEPCIPLHYFLTATSSTNIQIRPANSYPVIKWPDAIVPNDQVISFLTSRGRSKNGCIS